MRRYLYLFLLLILIPGSVLSFANQGIGVKGPFEIPAFKKPDFSDKIACRVIRIIDGDTIVVNHASKNVTVRLVGIDTPETKHPSKAVQYYGVEASLFMENMLKGEKVYLISDPTLRKTDR